MHVHWPSLAVAATCLAAGCGSSATPARLAGQDRADLERAVGRVNAICGRWSTVAPPDVGGDVSTMISAWHQYGNAKVDLAGDRLGRLLRYEASGVLGLRPASDSCNPDQGRRLLRAIRSGS
jgi:hypothetical protein